MHKTRYISLFLAIALILAAAPMAQAATMREGTVLGNYYYTPEGLSFTIPSGFEFVRHKTDSPDFMRIILNSPETMAPKTYIIIDVFTGPDDVANYTGDRYFESIRDTELLNFYTRGTYFYTSDCLIHEEMHDVFGNPELETLILFLITHDQYPHVTICYGFCWSTDSHFVRVCYASFGDRETLTEDIPKFLDLYTSMIVP